MTGSCVFSAGTLKICAQGSAQRLPCFRILLWKEVRQMDQTIRRIMELDAETEERLAASRAECLKIVADARTSAKAIEEAQAHQTRYTIEDYEEQNRGDSEKRADALRADYDRRAEEMTQQFEAQHDALLETLFAETLREAER